MCVKQTETSENNSADKAQHPREQQDSAQNMKEEKRRKWTAALSRFARASSFMRRGYALSQSSTKRFKHGTQSRDSPQRPRHRPDKCDEQDCDQQRKHGPAQASAQNV